MMVLGAIITHSSFNKKLLRELTASSALIPPSSPALRLKEGGKLSALSKQENLEYLRHLSSWLYLRNVLKVLPAAFIHFKMKDYPIVINFG